MLPIREFNCPWNKWDHIILVPRLEIPARYWIFPGCKLPVRFCIEILHPYDWWIHMRVLLNIQLELYSAINAWHKMLRSWLVSSHKTYSHLSLWHLLSSAIIHTSLMTGNYWEDHLYVLFCFGFFCADWSIFSITEHMVDG